MNPLPVLIRPNVQGEELKQGLLIDVHFLPMPSLAGTKLEPIGVCLVSVPAVDEEGNMLEGQFASTWEFHSLREKLIPMVAYQPPVENPMVFEATEGEAPPVPGSERVGAGEAP